MTIIASMILFLLIVFTKQEDAKKQIVILGFTHQDMSKCRERAEMV